MKKTIILSATLLTFTLSSYAQSDTNTIENQFNTLISQSNNWQNYKVVEKNKLQHVQQNVKDSIHSLQTTIRQNKAALIEQKTSIDSLSNQLTALQKELTIALDQENNLDFIGISTHKSTFKTIVWSIILILLLALGVLFTQFKKSFTDTKDARKKQLDAESELEEYKKLALEREQKIRRQLQDELNKNKRN
jgi:archaellum component FlaF (FlaF/FlaG flagellin family)